MLNESFSDNGNVLEACPQGQCSPNNSFPESIVVFSSPSLRKYSYRYHHSYKRIWR